MSTQIVLTSKTFLRVVIECVFKCRASLYPSSSLYFRPQSRVRFVRNSFSLLRICRSLNFDMKILLRHAASTGCWIEYCVISNILRYIPDSGLSRFPLGVSVCTQWQVKHQRCSRTCRLQKNNNILRKNTLINEHPVYPPLLFHPSIYLFI